MSFKLTPWESQFLQSAVTRWHEQKSHGAGNFSVEEYAIISSIQIKVQVPDWTDIDLTTQENEFLQSLFRMSKDLYGMGSDQDWKARQQMRQRVVFITNSILAKLRGEPRVDAPDATLEGEAVD